MPDFIPDSYLLRAKMHHPTLPDDHISRPRLLAQLGEIKHQQVVMVTAPAGYGKTTLVSAWIEQLHCPSAWLSLDKGDNDLSVFIDYLLAAIRSIFPDFGEQFLTFSQTFSLPPLPTIINFLLNEIDQIKQDFVLVLDDFHVLSNPDIYIVLEGLLRYPSSHFHLALTSRYAMPPQISKLRARGRIVEVRAQDLRFSVAEVADFTKQTLTAVPDPETIRILTEKTEGWPVGLRLATIALRRWGVSDHQPAILRVDNQYVVDYLVNEVLAQCSTAVNNFLLQSSILDRFSAPLCAALLGTETLDPLILPQLEREGLFIESLDVHKKWYRYHQLFRELLYRRLEQHFTLAEIATLHQRASVWLAANGFVEEAINHALLSGDMSAAANILSAQGIVLVNNERWQLIERLLNKFPSAIINENPNLLLLLAWLRLSRMKFAQVDVFREQLEAFSDAVCLTSEEKRFLNCSLHTFSAIKFNWTTEYEKAIYHAQQALSNTRPEWGLLHAYLWIHMGTAAHQLKGGDAGLTILGEDNYHASDILNKARKKIAIGFVDWMSGDLLKLTHTTQNGIELVDGLGLSSTDSMLYYLAGCAFYQRNDFEMAERHFSSVLNLKHGYQIQAYIFSILGQALIYQARNRVEDAWAMSETAVEFCLEIEHLPMLFFARAFQADLSVRQGRLDKAIMWVDQTDLTTLTNLMPYLYQPQMTPPKIWLAEGTADSLQKAEAELMRLFDIVTITHNIPCQIKVLVLQAVLYKQQKKAQLAETTLVQAIRLAEPGGFIRTFVDLGPEIIVPLKHLYRQGFAPTFLQKVLEAFPATSRSVPNFGQSQTFIDPLTEREMEVLSLLAQRLSNKEIANALVISPETVKRHTSNIYLKLGVKNRRLAVTKAYNLGLIVNIS